MITLLDTDAALYALAEEWAALWRRTPGAAPFTHPAWLLPWWRQFGAGRPLVAAQREDGGLVGLLPLYALDGRLLPMGAGITDYHDVLIEPGWPAAPLLQAALAGADICELLEVPPHSALRTACPPGWDAAWSEGSSCPALALPERVDDLPKVVPARTLRKLRMNRNRAERAGGYVIETATPTTVDSCLAELIRLHQSRWTSQGAPGVLSGPLVLAFHRESAPALVKAGLLRLQLLRVGGAVASACYALLPATARILFYLSGFDAAFAAVSPGALLLAAMLEQAIQEGRREADFLRGSEAYKYAWGGVDRLNGYCRLTRAAGSFQPPAPLPPT